MTATTEARAAAAEHLLRSQGLADVRVRALGREGEIAAVDAPLHHAASLEALAPELKSLGFRYVALDLTASEGSA